MNKWIVGLLLTVVLIGGCGKNASTDNSTNGTDQKPKVALIMKSLANEFFSTMANGAKQHQSEHAEQYDLIVNGIKDERDLGRQVALVEEMVSAGVEAIVIAPADSKALVPTLRRAAEAGIVIVNIDNRLDAEILAQENLTIPFVGPDNKAGAQKVGEALAQKLNKGDGVLVLEGIRTSFNAQQRREGFQQAMDDAGLKIIDSQTAEWEMSTANTVAAAMLSEHPEAKAILAANDSMAMGALSAAKSAGREQDLLIVGFDNISAIRQALKDGRVLATADQHGDQLAVYGIETALKLVANPESTPQDVETPVDLITADSLSQ